MRLADVLKLPKQPHSLAIIKEYLKQTLSHLDYQAAYHFYLEIAYEHALFELVYDEATQIMKEIRVQSETIYYEKILKLLIDAAVELHHYDEANDLIQERKRALPVVKEYLGTIDEIILKKALHEPYLDDLLKVKQDLIPDEIKIYILEELYELYRNEGKHELALETIRELYQYDLKTKYFIDEITLLITLERFEEGKKIAYDEHRKQKENTLLTAKLLELYVRLKDYHRASILEAEYEERFDSLDDLNKLHVYQLIVELYENLDNKFSIEHYQAKLKRLVRALDKKKKAEPQTVKKGPEDVVIIEKTEKPSKTASALLKYVETSYDLIQQVTLIDEKLPLRDFFRLFFSHLDQYIQVKEYVVYLETETPNFFQYKKERLYDKTIPLVHLEETLVAHLYETKTELYEKTKIIKWPKNIVTQKEYDETIPFVYAFPILDYGVFLVHMDQEVVDPAEHYDLFKLVSYLLFTRLAYEKQNRKRALMLAFYEQTLNSPILAYRELTESRSTYSEEAMALFEIEKHHHIELFLRDLSYEYVHPYKEAMSHLFAETKSFFTLQYKYQDKYIIEKMYGLKRDDEVVIVSTFYDQTEVVEDAKELLEQATVDPETNLANLYALNMAIDHHLEDKVSLLLLDFNMELKHIYGNESMMKFFKEFSQVTKKFFNDGEVYRFDFNQLLVIVPYNDIRTTTKAVRDFYKHIENYASIVLPYERFNVTMSILRYPVVTVEKDKDKLYRFLEIALEKAKRAGEEPYAYFSYKDYEDELFEQQVIDHLNVAIETNNIGLIFNQMIDIEKNTVWQYESEIVLTSLAIDGKYLLKVAEKRQRLVDLEFFHIEQVCRFLMELEEQTERLVKITIPISKPTFLDPRFNGFLLETLKKMGIPKEFIRLKFDMDLRPKHYATQIQELIDQGISLDTTSVQMALNYPFHALHLNIQSESIKWESYVKELAKTLASFHIAVVIRNVKNKEEKDMLSRLNIQYVEGRLYKELPAPILLRKIKEAL